MHQSHVLQCVISSVCIRAGRVDFPGTILDEIIAVFCLEELEPPGEHPVYRCSAAARKFTGKFFELPLCPSASSCCRIVEELEPPGVHPVYRCSAAAWKFAGKFSELPMCPSASSRCWIVATFAEVMSGGDKTVYCPLCNAFSVVDFVPLSVFPVAMRLQHFELV